MNSGRQIAITGMGIVCPIGIGKQAVWDSFDRGAGGIRALSQFHGPDEKRAIGGEILDFDPVAYVRPRKSLKVMSRDIQLAYAAADLAWTDAGLAEGVVPPERVGVVLGADVIQCDPVEIKPAFDKAIAEGRLDYRRWGEQSLGEIFPLWMLKFLPNMPACHVGISRDARGPNNTITLGEVSSLLAIAEGCRILERGQADVMLCGGASSRLHPMVWLRSTLGQLSRRADDPARACRPFDLHRDGMDNGEGAAVYVLETRDHAAARRAKAQAWILGHAGRFGRGDSRGYQRGVEQSIVGALKSAGLHPGEIGHVNADGLATTIDDQIEAQAICRTLEDTPVIAPKSYVGNLGAGTGAVELAASLYALETGRLPPTLNYATPDPACPIKVVRETQAARRATALVLNRANTGQAAALVLGADA